MCGRFTINLTYDELEKYVQSHYQNIEMRSFNLPRYNVAPGEDVIAILNDGKGFRIGEIKWGFQPKIIQDENFQMINARSESVFEKSTFKESILLRRCVVVADGFYEWDKKSGSRKPYLIHTNDKVFRMAAIWNVSIDKTGKKIFTLAIMTIDSNDMMHEIHDRMPVILDDESERIWLNPKIMDIHSIQKVFKKYPSDLMFKHQVSNKVNNSKNKSVEVVEVIKL
ncbi:Uncharacterised ACR, COG2135 [Acholeplasma oculi]|uniref:Abasic site processing protein n=1 Tax=Acholeplasma oculi TaxID=35623 RepID=A0A061AGQ8_9MOLU|nr:SOS response-associated peptidase [Acholeplasma oculi]CDR30736.1 hypothetical protein, DUF159 [Acholeplasma oculi]SKC34799.1 Putative SOS response-associated peptidase YedK [Acholeplasma oculi]SUT89612.1 Uncharacterised ACR, COG2135 [Acholeplasma oculi]